MAKTAAVNVEIKIDVCLAVSHRLIKSQNYMSTPNLMTAKPARRIQGLTRHAIPDGFVQEK